MRAFRHVPTLKTGATKAGFLDSAECLLKRLGSLPPWNFMCLSSTDSSPPLIHCNRQQDYLVCNMARAKKQRSRKNIAPRPRPNKPFPFLSLPPEIRLMVYDVAMPEEIHLTGHYGSPGLPSTIRALIKVKGIREELIPHLFGRYHFAWIRASTPPRPRGPFRLHIRCEYEPDRFKPLAIAHISSLSIRFTGPVALNSHRLSLDDLDLFLRWARWRSLRSHLYTWSLEKLTLVEAFEPPGMPFCQFRRFPNRWKAEFSRDASRFLTNIPVVPGLQSLKIVLNNPATKEAMKAFLERCAGCEIDGRVAYCLYGQENVPVWFRLQDNQVVRTDG